jgi:alkaline phosphatase D
MRIGLFALVILRCVGVCHAESVVSTFDTGVDGWNIADLRSYGPYDPPLGTYPLSWNAAEGYAWEYDPSSNSFFMNAPAKFLGDKSAYYGGQLTFQLKSTIANWANDNVVVIVGNNGKIICALIEPLPTTTWTSYRIPLLPSKFLYDGKNGQVVTESDFRGVLQNIKALRISGEYGAQVQETVGLDNVIISTDRVLGLSNRAAHSLTAQAVSPFYRFRMWGRAEVIDASSLWLDDGSGLRVKVVAPGYSGVAGGDYAAATGYLGTGASAGVLTCLGSDVNKLQ